MAISLRSLTEIGLHNRILKKGGNPRPKTGRRKREGAVLRRRSAEWIPGRTSVGVTGVKVGCLSRDTSGPPEEGVGGNEELKVISEKE